MIAPRPGPEESNRGTDERPADLGRLLERNVLRGVDAWADLRTLRTVATDRFQLRVQRLVVGAQAALTASIAMILAATIGVVVLALGLCRTLEALFAGQPGVGEMVAGIVLLLLAAGAWHLARTLLDRANLRRLEAKHERLEAKRAAPHGEVPHAEA